MEKLMIRNTSESAQRSTAAVHDPARDAAVTVNAAVPKGPGRAPDKRVTHKRKGRIDRRVQAYRMRAARERQLAEHLGGTEAMSVVQESLARRWATLDLRAAQMESDVAAGKPFDLTSFIYIVDRLHALSRTLGLTRRARNVPTLHQYLQDKTSAPPDAATLSPLPPRAGHPVGADLDGGAA